MSHIAIEEEIELTPAEDNPWYEFMGETKSFDYANNKPSGWGWFWAVRHLYNDQPEDLYPEIEAIQAKLPDGHWLKKINPNFEILDEINLENRVNGLFIIADDFEKNHLLTSAIDLSKLQFNDYGVFSDFIFLLDVYFDDTKFSDTANFNNTLFCGKVIFDGVTFSKNAYFKKAEFFEGAIFTNATFHKEIKFDGAAFEGHTDFINTKFKKYVPSFHKADFHSNTSWSWEVELWPQTKKHTDDITDENQETRITKNQSAYENLSSHMKNLDKYHDEHFFYRQEMCCRRWRSSPAVKFFYYLYEKLADYGYGIKQALWGWFWHMVLGAQAIVIVTFICACWKGWTWETAKGVLCSIPLSFANAHGFLPFHKGALKDCYELFDGNILFNIIWGFQTVLGIVFLFLLLTTIRIRFRLK